MRRAQIIEHNKPLVVSEAAIPSPPPKGLVVKTSFGGICHSEIHQWENTLDQGSDAQLHFTDNPYYKLPVVPGHEISGVVYALGPDADSEAEDLKVGDRVTVFPWIGCGMCGYCKNGENNLCAAKHINLGMMLPGGYSNFVVVREKRYAVKLPDSIPLDVACMFSCAGLTTFNAVSSIKPHVEKAVSYTGSASILIIGAGGLGLWSTQIAKNILPSKCVVTVADVSEEKLEMARERGCDDTMCWKPSMNTADVVEKSKSMGHFDAIIDFVNNSITSDRAFRCLKSQGMLVMVGLFGGEGKFSLPKVVLTTRKIQGVLVGNLQNMKDLIKLAATKKLIPPPIQYYNLEDVTKALILMRDGKMKGRGIIKFTDDVKL